MFEPVFIKTIFVRMGFLLIDETSAIGARMSYWAANEIDE